MSIARYIKIFAVLFLLVGIIGCKSEFEKIRTSGDAEAIYKTAVQYYEDREYLRAQTLIELILGVYRGKPELEELYFKYAYTYFYLESYTLAAYYFDNFSNTFSTSALREEADYMTAYSYYKLSPSFRLDQGNTASAINEFQLFVNTYPDSERVDECNQLMDIMRQKMERKAFATAELYYDLKQYQAATQSFENLLKDFPETEDTERIRYRIVESYFYLADNSIYEKRKERYESARKAAEDFLDKYTKSEYRKAVENILENSILALNTISADGGYQESSARAGS
ncbi:MAG: outer membrane protein assembly factor BamD [Bacteroidota bacterium]